jgi:hypothetical protein
MVKAFTLGLGLAGSGITGHTEKASVLLWGFNVAINPALL